MQPAQPSPTTTGWNHCIRRLSRQWGGAGEQLAAIGVDRANDSEGLQEPERQAAMNTASILLSDQRMGSMNTLVLRQVPDALYRRLKAVAAAHRRSMNQEAILALEAGLPGPPAPSRPTAEESRRWLEEQVWSLPLLDERGAEEILGYGNDGLCG